MNACQPGLVCVSLAPESVAGLAETIDTIQESADVVELRLDGMRDQRLAQGSLQLARPILATNRPVWEGGQFTGSEEERITLLCQAIAAGARYADIELRTEPTLRERVLQMARSHQCQVVISHHDFAMTPRSEHLQDTLNQMMASGAGIGKIVTTAADTQDALRVLALQGIARAHNFPLCAFAMGAAGRISRFATLYLGGFMTYAALTEAQATAPGQLTLAHLRALMGLFARSA